MGVVSRIIRIIPGLLIAAGTAALILVSAWVSNTILAQRITAKEAQTRIRGLLQDVQIIQGRLSRRINDLLFLKTFADRGASVSEEGAFQVDPEFLTVMEALLSTSPNLAGAHLLREDGGWIVGSGQPLPWTAEEREATLREIAAMDPQAVHISRIAALPSSDPEGEAALFITFGCQVQMANAPEKAMLFLIYNIRNMLHDLDTQDVSGHIKSIVAADASWSLSSLDGAEWRLHSMSESKIFADMPETRQPSQWRKVGKNLLCLRRLGSEDKPLGKFGSNAPIFNPAQVDWRVAVLVPGNALDEEIRQQQAGVWLVATVAMTLFLPVTFVATIWFRGLMRANRQLDRIFESSMHGLVALEKLPGTGNEGYRILRSNRAARPLMDAQGGFIPEARAWILDALHSSKVVAQEYEIQRPSGSVWFFLRAAPMPGGLVLSFADVTRRKRDERKLIEREAALRLAARISKVGYWFIEYPSGIIQWSQETRQIHGVPEDFQPDMATALSFYPPETRERITRALDRCEKGEPFEFETGFRDADGRVMQVRLIGEREVDPETGAVRRLYGTIQDITDIYRAALSLAESREQLSLAFWGGGMGRSDRRLDTNEVVFDRNWARALGYEPDEVQDTLDFWRSLVPEEDQRTFEEACRQYFDGEVDYFETEYRMRAKDGSYRWVLNRGRITEVNDAGRPVRLSGVMIDITSRKAMEQKLAVALQKEQGLVKASQAAERAKRNFLAIMSHEIRTPMNSILGFAEILANSKLDAEEQEYARTIKESGEALLRTLDDILDYSRIESGRLHVEKTVFSLRDTVASVIELFAKAVEAKGIQLRQEIADDVPALLVGDPGRLSQILINLVGNAVKFTAAGSINIHVQKALSPSSVAIIQFCVSDTGAGIPSDKLDRIFEPFMQADETISRSYGGTGLGLAISNILVQLLGGKLEAQSVYGQGAQFSFSLPFGQRADLPPVKKPPAFTARAQFFERHPMRILIAEDDPVNARLTRLVLEKLGYAPVLVSDGQAAVEARSAGDYDMILMDLHMPKMDGIHAARSIRNMEATQGLPPVWICAFTADVLPEEKASCLEAGMNDHITKPLAMSKLCDALLRAFQSIEARGKKEGMHDGKVEKNEIRR